MKRAYIAWLVTGILLLGWTLAPAQWGGAGAWGSLKEFLASAHTWEGKQTLNGGIESTTGDFSGVVNATSTDPSTIANLESGISPWGVNGNTTLTANRVYSVRGLAAAPIAKIDGTLTPGSKYFVIDHSRSGDPVQSLGVTVWAKDKTILFGSGSSADSGQTIFVISGETGYVLQFLAVDANTLKMFTTDATVYHVD